MSEDRLLILGLGNPLMGDDGVGIKIIHELQRRKLSGNVDLMDGGTAGLDLVDMLSGCRPVIIVDAVRVRDNRSPEIRLFSTDELIPGREDEAGYSVHDTGLAQTMRLMEVLGMEIPEITIMGVPAVSIAPGAGLSEECSRLVQVAANLLMELLPAPPVLNSSGARGIL